MITDLEKFSVPKLLGLYAEILEELRARKVIRSWNAPLGDYCEYLFCNAMEWQQETNSKTGYDAIDNKGIKHQIKGRRPTKENRSRQLSFIRRLPEKQFDFLAAILFNEDYSVNRAAIIPHAVVHDDMHSRYSEHANGWLFRLEDAIWEIPDVLDVTQNVKNYEATLLQTPHLIPAE